MYTSIIGRVFLVVCLQSVAAQLWANDAVNESGQETPEITLAAFDNVPANAREFLRSFYSEAFRRAGYNLNLLFLPSARANAMNDKIGDVDGQALRSAEYGDVYPELVRVPEKTLTSYIDAYSLDPGLKLSSFADLAGREWRVTMISGASTLELALSQVVPEERLLKVREPVQGLRMLQLQRTDLFVDYRQRLNLVFGADERFRHGLYFAGALASTNLHMYLKQRHKDLALELAGHLREMKAEGLQQKMADRYNVPQ